MYFLIYAASVGISMGLDKLFQNSCNTILGKEGFEFYDKTSSENIVGVLGFICRNLIPGLNLINSVYNLCAFDNEYPKYKNHLLLKKQIFAVQSNNNQQRQAQPQPVQQVQNNQQNQENRNYIHFDDLSYKERLDFLNNELGKLDIFLTYYSDDCVNCPFCFTEADQQHNRRQSRPGMQRNQQVGIDIDVSDGNNAPYYVHFDKMTEKEKLRYLRREAERLSLSLSFYQDRCTNCSYYFTDATTLEPEQEEAQNDNGGRQYTRTNDNNQ